MASLASVSRCDLPAVLDVCGQALWYHLTLRSALRSMAKAPINSAAAGPAPACGSPMLPNISRWQCWSILVHLDKDDPPDDLVLAIAEIPDDRTRESLHEKDLPRNWRDAAPPPDPARFGDEFAARSEHCVLLVPSALVPRESNCLINPAHSDFTAILFRETEPLDYDPRMFREYPRGSSKAR